MEFMVTPRDPVARQHLSEAQADVMKSLQGVSGVSWQYNDPGAQAVIIRLPSNQVDTARSILNDRYMLDQNAGLQPL
jgi:hypothetical protein